MGNEGAVGDNSSPAITFNCEFFGFSFRAVLIRSSSQYAVRDQVAIALTKFKDISARVLEAGKFKLNLSPSTFSVLWGQPRE